MHSHDYKEPSQFKNQIVLIIGGKASATDISIQICPIAQKVSLKITQQNNFIICKKNIALTRSKITGRKISG